MNHLFAEATTSVAFALLLSKNQCNSLLRSVDHKSGDLLHLMQVHTLKTLQAHGLVFWRQDANGKPNGYGGLTPAGELVAALLREAGMTIENTNTVSMLKRIERMTA
jgi:DNA-binding HxlR family transcriptional regulator